MSDLIETFKEQRIHKLPIFEYRSRTVCRKELTKEEIESVIEQFREYAKMDIPIITASQIPQNNIREYVEPNPGTSQMYCNIGDDRLCERR